MTRWRTHVKKFAPVFAPDDPAGAVESEEAEVALRAAERPILGVMSTPTGADIEINGWFVGSTPSIVEVDPGDQEVRILKKGFEPWVRKIRVRGGTLSLNADLEAVQG